MPRIVAESSPEAKYRVSPASRAMVASRAVRSLAGSIALTWVIVVCIPFSIWPRKKFFVVREIPIFFFATQVKQSDNHQKFERKNLCKSLKSRNIFLPGKKLEIARLVALAL